jgi:hypothetical protein
MHTDQFAELALGEAKRSPSGPHHDGQMGPPALFCASFNNFFAAHKIGSPLNAKGMKYNHYYIKNVTKYKYFLNQNIFNFKINNNLGIYLIINQFIDFI